MLLSFGLVASLAPLMTVAASLDKISAEWGLSASQSGWLGGIFFAGYAAAVPILARATDHIDGRRLYFGCSLLGAAASFVFAVGADGPATALLLRFLGGIAVAGVHMPGLNLLMERVEPSRQARASAVYTSCYAAGNAGSFLLGGLVDAAFGWRASFAVAGIGPLIALGALAWLPSPLPRAQIKSGPSAAGSLYNRDLIAYVVAFAGNTWEVFAVRVWFVAYLSWTLRLPGNHIATPPLGVISAAAAFLGVPVSIVMATAAERWGRRRIIPAICAVSVIVCLALAYTAGGPSWVVLGLMVAVQITSFADVGALGSGVVAAADPQRRGAALALYAFVGFLTGFLGPVIFGVALEGFGGMLSARGWQAAFLATALGSVIAAVAVRLTRHAPAT
jgi:MFS family permease